VQIGRDRQAYADRQNKGQRHAQTESETERDRNSRVNIILMATIINVYQHVILKIWEFSYIKIAIILIVLRLLSFCAPIRVNC